MPSFRIDLAHFAGSTKVSLIDIVRKIVIEVFVGAVVRTPVDTGRARGNWLPGPVPMSGFDWNLHDPACTATAAKITAYALTIVGDGHSWLTNNLPYIEGLEKGHSMQAPRGMAKRSVEEYGSFLASIGTPIRP